MEVANVTVIDADVANHPESGAERIRRRTDCCTIPTYRLKSPGRGEREPRRAT
jgi:hypothetical protein